MTLHRRAQSLMEYMILLSIITIAIATMLPGMKRTTQSMMKSAADQIGDQKGAEQTLNDIEKGYLVNSITTGKSFVNNLRTEKEGAVEQRYDERTTTTTKSFTNAGWSKE